MCRVGWGVRSQEYEGGGHTDGEECMGTFKRPSCQTWSLVGYEREHHQGTIFRILALATAKSTVVSSDLQRHFGELGAG